MAKKTRSKDNTALNIEALEREKRELYKAGNNPKRLKEVKSKLDYLYFGIK